MLKSHRPHIGIFGRTNVGKSSFINALTGQEIAIVSEQSGTTTDPVNKTLELLELGPVVMIDTAGIDDPTDLGKKRVAATNKVIKNCDFAILLFANNEWGEFEEGLIAQFKNEVIPYLVIHNKEDLEKYNGRREGVISFSAFALTDEAKKNLILKIKAGIPETVFSRPTILGDLVGQGDLLVLVTPIDEEAPAGRLILPQVQTIRDSLDHDAICVVLKERELDHFFRTYNMKPKLVVTDSQAFLKVDALTPSDVPLTSFSILFSRIKGDFDAFIKGTPAIYHLSDGDRVLLLESCSHNVSCDDIGRVKIPRWLSNFTGKKLEYDIVASLDDPPRPIEEYALVIQCGGCMLTRRQVIAKLKPAIEKGIPVTNYGMTIALCHGIFERSVAPFVKVKSSDELL